MPFLPSIPRRMSPRRGARSLIASSWRRLSRMAVGPLLGLFVMPGKALPDEGASLSTRGAPPVEELALAHTGAGMRATPVPAAATSVPLSTAPERATDTDTVTVRRSELPGSSLPWVFAGDIEQPGSLGEPSFECTEPDFSPWVLFEDRLDKRLAPAALPDHLSRDLLPLFYIPPPRETELSLKVQKLIRKKMYREIRSKVRKQWREQFRDSPSITYSQYEERLIGINHIGRDQSEYDSFDVEYSTIETKQDLFRYKSKDGEADIPLVTLGPLIFTDSGQLQFDVGTATHADDVKLDVGGEKNKCLVGGEKFRVDTKLDFKVDPLRAFQNGDVRNTVRSYGITVEVDYLTDVLSRDMISAEVEYEADLEGDYAVFANIVLKGR